jgi:ATP-dependent Clp protease ATP-binding subunit ClpC
MEINVVLKYCEIIDEFIKVRVFTDEEARRILRSDSLANKKSYMRFVVHHCIVNFEERIAPRIAKITDPQQVEIVEEFLYHLCVEVNPFLEIHNVTLPIAEGSSSAHAAPAPATATTQIKAAQALQNTRLISHLDTLLRRRVIGQDEAIKIITRSIQKAAVGLRDPRRPIGAFLFIGQTGVGKTELAKALSECLYRDPYRLVRVDCSEYSLPHEYAKLIGAPPGYVGHAEGGYLTEKVKELGSCIVLFDEIEKAHTKMHNILLQLLDEATVTDSRGSRVSFRDTVVILTSNLGIEELEALQGRVGFRPDARPEVTRPDQIREATMRALKENFRPEFLNRIDETILFNTLGFEDCVAIVGKMLHELSLYVQKTGIRLVFNRRVKEFLAREGYNRDFGARELRRTIAKRVESPLTEKILDGGVARGATVRLDVHRGEVVILQKRPSPAAEPPKTAAVPA